MFSEKFFVVEKYNLDDTEYIGTYENIFLEFTSLENNIYKPEIENKILEKLRKVLNYKFNNNTIPLNTEESTFGITYFGNDIINYDIKFKIDYNEIRNNFLWEDFVLKTDMTQLSGLKYLIDEKISKTDILTNYISELEFNNNGDVTGIGIFDIDYKETKENSDINFINNFSNTNSKYIHFLIFNADKTYKSTLSYKNRIIGGKYKHGIEEKNLVLFEFTNYDAYNNIIISDMIKNNIINQDDADFIQSHLKGERYFMLEFDIDANEKIINRTVGIVTHNLFREL